LIRLFRNGASVAFPITCEKLVFSSTKMATNEYVAGAVAPLPFDAVPGLPLPPGVLGLSPAAELEPPLPHATLKTKSTTTLISTIIPTD
jgi:hypothetical protein